MKENKSNSESRPPNWVLDPRTSRAMADKWYRKNKRLPEKPVKSTRWIPCVPGK